MKSRYSKQLLEEHVPNSRNFCDLARNIDGIERHGNITAHLKRLTLKYGINTEHFDGKQHRVVTSTKYIPPKDRLVLRKEGTRRWKAVTLRRSLLEIGRQHQCEICGQPPTWKGKPLVLEIDHKNGIVWDDRPENLRFLCPHCHSQTNNYKNKNGSVGE